MRKNDIVPLEITGMTNEGNGVGRYEGMAVFVPLTAVGDKIDCRIVKVQKSFCYGKIERLIAPSQHRCEPECGVFSKCGGCAFCHFTYEEELRVKLDFVRSSFERIGKLPLLPESITGSEKTAHYRNKAQYPVAMQEGRAVCGFYSRRSHRVIEQHSCNLQPEIFEGIIDRIMGYVNQNAIPAYDEITGKGALRHIYLRRGENTGEIMLCLVITSKAHIKSFEGLYPALVSEFDDIKSIVININSKNTNAILGKEYITAFGKGTIDDIMCGRRVTLSPSSFYQVNTPQAQRLYGKAAEYAALKEGEILLDLYCGTGTIGLSLIKDGCRLIGADIVPSSIDNAKRNAIQNGIENAEFICADAAKAAQVFYERGERPDVIIADPARKGCDRATLELMAKMSPKRIVMISCDHSTAARDIAVLRELGYNMTRCEAVDLFPRTAHVECISLMERSKSNDRA